MPALTIVRLPQQPPGWLIVWLVPAIGDPLATCISLAGSLVPIYAIGVAVRILFLTALTGKNAT